MKGLLVRVGCDQTKAGGNWNAPVSTTTWDYVYVPIPADEDRRKHIFPCPTYSHFKASVEGFGATLPSTLSSTMKVHLDPDFESLSFGEPYIASRGKLSSRGEIINQLSEGDFIAFFAAFRPVDGMYDFPLAYCLFGIFHIRQKGRVKELKDRQKSQCAHGRRKDADNDIVIWADPTRSGRFSKAIPIGEYRDRAYRVRQDLLEAWGGLRVRNGYIQRSVRPPFFENPLRFLEWLERQQESTQLLHQN